MRAQRRIAQSTRAPKQNQNPADDLWGEIDTRYEIGMEARRPFEAHWSMNLAFFSGYQYSYFNTATHTLHHADPVKGRVRLVDNQLLPRVRRQIANSIKKRPEMSVVPNSSDPEDIRAAKVGNDVMEHVWRINKMQRKLRVLNTWRYICGNAFLDDRWNPQKGPMKPIKNPETGEVELHYQGDIDCGVWSPFEVLVPAVTMGDTDIHTMPWIMKMRWRDIDWIRNNYDRGKDVSPEQMPQAVFDSLGMVGSVLGSTSPRKTEGAMVKELYIQPCHQFSEGKFLVGANGTMLDDQDYPFDAYNIEQFKDIDVPGFFWGMATMQAAIGLQKSWNRTVSGIDEFNKKMAKGKGLVPRGCNIEALPDDNHGEWIEYTPYMGYKPEILQLKGLPQTYELMLTMVKSSLQDIFSQHEVTQGTNRSDIRSGDMVALLLEQDAFGMIPSQAIFEEGLENVMGRVLERIQQGYDGERTIKVIGKDGAWKVKDFKGADLKNNTDVHVKTQSSLPDSRVAMEAQIMNRFEKGYYGNPEDPRVRRHVQRLLDDAQTTEDIYEDMRLDETNANMENDVLSSGKVEGLQVNVYDNHSIHQEEHYRYRKSRKHQDLKFKKPQAFMAIEQAFERHQQQHAGFIKEQQQQQMQKVVAMDKARKGSR